MKNPNAYYNYIAKVLNELELTPDDLFDVVILLAAQMPNASATMARLFTQTDGVFGPGSELTRVKGLCDPYAHDEIVEAATDPPTVELAEFPESADDAPIIYVGQHPSRPSTFTMDKYATGVMCRFHSASPPCVADFERHDTEELILKLSYQHVDGGFTVHLFMEGHAFLVLFGGFSLDSFIPVRVKLKPTTN